MKRAINEAIICVRRMISSSHHLPGYCGKCKNPHGHNWVIEIAINGKINDKTGMVMDFKRVKQIVDGVLDCYDHQNLNEFLINPTAENLAVQLMIKLKDKFIGEDCKIVHISIEETPGSKVIFNYKEAE